MWPPGEPPQHADSIGSVARLAQNFATYYHNGVCAQHDCVGILFAHRARFVARPALCILYWRFLFVARLLSASGLQMRSECPCALSARATTPCSAPLMAPLRPCCRPALATATSTALMTVSRFPTRFHGSCRKACTGPLRLSIPTASSG